MVEDVRFTSTAGVFAETVYDPTNTAFVLMPFAEAFDDVYEIIRRAAEDVGYECRRADDDAAPGRITDTIYRGIYNAEVLIADLTGQNPNVFYELGLAHAISNNVLLIAQDIEDVPFDLSHFRLIGYENSIGGGSQLTRDLTEALQAIASQGTQTRPRQGLDTLPEGTAPKPGALEDLEDQPTIALVMMSDVAVKSNDRELARQLIDLIEARIEAGESLGGSQLSSVGVDAELIGEPEIARRLFERAYEADADNDGVRLSYASYLLDLENRTPADVALAGELLDWDFGDTQRALQLTAQLARETGQDAETAADQMVEAFLNNPQGNPAGILVNLGELGRLDDARKVIDTWLTHHPDEEFKGKRYLAELLRNSDEPEDESEAALLYRELLEMDKYPDARTRAADMTSLAVLLALREGGSDEALGLAREAYGLAPADPIIRSIAAQLMAQEGETEMANRVLRGQPLGD